MESLILRSSRMAKVMMSDSEWVLQNSLRVSRLTDVNEVVNSDLGRGEESAIPFA